MLVSLHDVLIPARHGHYAVAAFDCMEDVMIRTILDVAQQEQAPVILMALDHDLKGHGIAYIAGLVRAVADAYPIPIVLHLDHATSKELVVEAIKHGFTSVMYDGSVLPFEDNLRKTREVVEMAHAHGVSVEAELGCVAGSDIYGSAYPGAGTSLLTDPNQVVEFVERTQVDALAVSIGTAHGVYTAQPTLDIELLKAINAVSQVPLVLHGGSGTPVEQVHEAIRYGITKVNIYTELRIAMFEGLKASASSQKREDPLPDELFTPIRHQLSLLVADKIHTLYLYPKLVELILDEIRRHYWETPR
ncbi:ketose-bisphosphate aldolase [candidate division KSB3 bacterium]|uniref:Ketose-bisphosphate aldolase n=1 Tax=candidate division KSB3 bacterium TaxID=2044937 RepID=A0A9D5JTG4_9BACT|nr:ketose-bisphosphate aldolase [candidate division KSB3 bacterium]MBD3323912.1 ketose-bisphosphate aldolase [candidate division KSB3 bacterium]